MQRPPCITGFVFFAINRDRAYVHVGYSTEPRASFRKLQTATPDDLALTLVIPGTEHTYRAIAAKIAGCHVRGGWYDSRMVAGILLGLNIKEVSIP